MWPTSPSHHEQSAFVLLFFMAATRLLSECQTLYEWDYDEDTEEGGFRISGSPYRTHNTETGSRLVTYGYEVDYDDDDDDDNDDESYSDDMSDDLPKSQLLFPMNGLSKQQTLELRERLKGLYAMLKMHPALMGRRLQVGSKKPDIPTRHHSRHTVKKSFNVAASRPVCPTRAAWRLLHVARDINDTEVEVFQPSTGDRSQNYQWFYITSCDNSHADMNSHGCPRCCRGINRERYHSRCTTVKSFVIAFVRKPGDQQYDWKWIQINSSCTCSISNV